MTSSNSRKYNLLVHLLGSLGALQVAKSQDLNDIIGLLAPLYSSYICSHCVLALPCFPTNEHLLGQMATDSLQFTHHLFAHSPSVFSSLKGIKLLLTYFCLHPSINSRGEL